MGFAAPVVLVNIGLGYFKKPFLDKYSKSLGKPSTIVMGTVCYLSNSVSYITSSFNIVIKSSPLALAFKKLHQNASSNRTSEIIVFIKFTRTISTDNLNFIT